MAETTEPLDPLALRFASSRPDELAGVLAGEAPSDLSAFIAGLPETVAAPVITRLPSWQMTRLLGSLEPALISRMLTEAAQDDAVAIVSHLHASRYSSIIAATPTDKLYKLRQLLEYPTHSLASMASTGFIRLDAAMLCGTCCEQLSASADTRPRPVLVVDAQGKYVGMIPLQVLYARRNRTRPVGELASQVEPLSGLTSAESALTSRLWLRYTALPVVDHRHRLLGVVTRAMLQRVAGRETAVEFTLDRVVGELAAGYLTLCGNLLESVLSQRR